MKLTQYLLHDFGQPRVGWCHRHRCELRAFAARRQRAEHVGAVQTVNVAAGLDRRVHKPRELECEGRMASLHVLHELEDRAAPEPDVCGPLHFRRPVQRIVSRIEWPCTVGQRSVPLVDERCQASRRRRARGEVAGRAAHDCRYGMLAA